MKIGFDEFISVSAVDERLPPELVSEFNKRAIPFRKKRNQAIVSQTDQTTDVYLILKGRVEFSLLAADSRETLFRDGEAGDIFGELSAISGEVRSLTATALCDTQLCRMTSAQFKVFLEEDREFREWFDRLLVRRIHELSQRVFALSTMTVNCRIWMDLIARSERAGIRNGRSVIEDFPIHKKLASQLGTHREAVSRELSELAKEGLIQQTGRTMTVLNVPGLKQLCGRHARQH